MIPWNLRHLEGLVEIRRSRSFSIAAERINLSQSALTQGVASIEKSLGRQLFERRSTGVRPTHVGEVVADSIEKALTWLNNTGRAVLPLTERRPELARCATGTQLSALASVERAGSYRAGAREAGLTEASVHRAVRDLEASLGAKLIVGTRSGSKPTAAGTAIAQVARQVAAELSAGFEAAQRDQGRRLVIGAMPMVRAGLLPRAAAQLCDADPSASLLVIEGAYGDLLTGLLDGRLDMLLGALRTESPEGVVQHRLFDDELVIVARHDHPLAQSSNWDAALLTRFPWAASPPGTPRRDRWEQMLRAEGLNSPIPKMECSSASVVRGLLLQGEWLAMLSPDQFRIERELGLLVPVAGPLSASRRQIGVTVRTNWDPGCNQGRFIDILRNSVRRPDELSISE